MQFDCESGECFINPTASDLDRLLTKLDGKNNSYASLTMPNGSYIQTGGQLGKFLVEIREIKQGGAFQHFKAGFKNERINEYHLIIGGADVFVMENQVLNAVVVRKLFHFFLRERSLDPSMQWQDVTRMFERTPPIIMKNHTGGTASS